MANPTVTIETNHGTITAELFSDLAPKTAGNFMELAKKGYYDGIIFHRIIEGFMIQGGDPTGTGRGGPGYQYAGEFAGGRKHNKPGMLSMANAGPNTDGSQFFLTFAKTPHLNGLHTVFGGVVDGMGTVDDLEKSGSQSGRTTEKLFIRKATISVE